MGFKEEMDDLVEYYNTHECIENGELLKNKKYCIFGLTKSNMDISTTKIKMQLGMVHVKIDLLSMMKPYSNPSIQVEELN